MVDFSFKLMDTARHKLQCSSTIVCFPKYLVGRYNSEF